MLKLEKTSNLSGLTVRLREREGFFEPRLVQALAIALFLHCGALLLFQVTPFYLSSTFTFPPIEVQSAQPLQGVSTLVTPYMEEEEEMNPPLTLIPKLDWVSFPQESILTPSLDFNPHLFQSLEERVWPKWQMPALANLEEPHIQLVISGDLAEHPLIATDPLLNQMQPFSPRSSPAYVTYQVQMDDKTGELFWYERIQSSGVAALDSLTEKILLNLRFALSESREVLMGTLNFVILVEEKN